MPSSRNFLPAYSIVNSTTGTQLANNITSLVTDVRYLNQIVYQMNLPGTPTGTFAIQGSLDYNPGFGSVINTGTWIAIPMVSTPTASGSAVNLIAQPNLNVAHPFVRLVWTSTATGAQTIKPVADVAGSLAGTYFLLVDGNNANKWAIWFKVSGVGSAPSVSGYTNVEQDISTNDTAATIGGDLATTIAALNATNSFTTAGTTTVTVTNKVSGPFAPAVDGAGALATGFTFTPTTGSGTLAAYISGKSI